MSRVTCVEVRDVVQLPNRRYRIAFRVNGTDSIGFAQTTPDATFADWSKIGGVRGDMWTLKIGTDGSIIDMWQ